ncbi:MAG: 1-(5-phosphoribosyl)-5-[(5-phosphoribosylamino)methylideneamino] imidazole-4-carboxamide isomerase [Bacteroidia bacterium]|nr:1-(5-phosphoribosyl)-5-[(5-phosphoribosylamino)methylideneamino] imidazole-4-carboxamide isomerase [Bacteroidia bacterium]
MIVIPAIDIYQNKVARLYKGSYEQATFYEGTPLEFAQNFKSWGFTHLHIVDLEGARSGKSTILKTVEEICLKTGLVVDVGGGIRTLDDVRAWLDSGASKVNMGSALASNPALLKDLIAQFSEEKIIFSADIKDGNLMVSGWEKSFRKNPEEIIQELLDYGLKYIACTDVSKDGTLSGIRASFYADLIQKFPTLKWIAGGGIAGIEDVITLRSLGCHASIVGKALYENGQFLKKLSEIC